MNILSKHAAAIGTIVYISYWIGAALAAVHQQMPVRTVGETYGWIAPIGIAVVTIPTAFFAFLWGRKSAEQ